MAAERTIATDRPWAGRLISVRVDLVELSNGSSTSREVVEHPGAVGILAWDDAAGRVAMVRQWRQAAAAELLEIPAGTLEPGEEPATTARRELGEECGLAADRWERGPSFFTAPGFCTERLTLFLAGGLRAVDTARPQDEELDLSWMSLDEALAAIDGGRISDAKSIAGILWLARRTGEG